MCTLLRNLYYLFFHVLGPKYSIFTNLYSYPKAQAACQHKYGNLASFTTMDDIITIKRLANNSGYRHWWTGLKYNKSSDAWYFIDGTDTRFALSMLGIRHFESDKCVAINKIMTLDADDCAKSFGYICENDRNLTHLSNLTG